MEQKQRMESGTNDGMAETTINGNTYTCGDLDVKRIEGDQSDGDGTERFTKSGNKSDEVVIMVVSNGPDHKASIIRAVTKQDSESWTEAVTLAGSRVLSREHPFRKIIDTTPLDYVSGKSPTAIARKWISQNSLRRIMVRNFVVGVCVITVSSILTAPCTSNVFAYDNCWVDVLRIIFREQRHAILFIIKHDKEIDESTRRKITRFIRNHDFHPRHIIFSGFDDEVTTVLEDSVGMVSYPKVPKRNAFLLFFQKILSWRKLRRLVYGKVEPGWRSKWNSQYKKVTSSLFVVTPFFMGETTRQKHAAWSSERIILFGRTGSGKSTLAKMLTTGNLNSDSTAFRTSSSIRGVTKAIEQGEGRGWYIVDTPGFGESRGPDSTISTEEVQSKLKKFVDLVEGTFAHYIFVVKKDRVDQLEVNLWHFFRLLFGEEIGAQFSIVFSNASQDWLDENMQHLQKSFAGCNSFLCAEFPALDDDSDGYSQELREENESIQKESLARLEQELAKLDRCDRPCRYGKDSRVSKIIERDRAHSDMKVERSLRARMIVQGSEALFRVDELFSGLIRHLTVNDRIVLEPLVL